MAKKEPIFKEYTVTISTRDYNTKFREVMEQYQDLVSCCTIIPTKNKDEMKLVNKGNNLADEMRKVEELFKNAGIRFTLEERIIDFR